LTEQQIMIRDAARKFALEELAEGAQERDMTEEFPIHLIKKLGDLGLIGIQYPKEYGGQGGDYLSYVLAIEELCKVDSAFGIAYSISTTGFAGAIADYCFLVANTDLSKGSKGLTAFLVDLKTTPGVRVGHIENKCGIRSAKVAELIFENCEIPASRMIGQEGKGLRYALTILNAGRIGVAAQGLGLAQGAFDTAKEYMKERKQFGRPICTNQYLAFRMADMETQIDMARLLLYKATWEQQNDMDFAISAAKAKLACTNLAMETTVKCLQFFGGYGYTKEYAIERMMRDAKITQIYEGTNEIQKMVIGRAIGL